MFILKYRSYLLFLVIGLAILAPSPNYVARATTSSPLLPGQFAYVQDSNLYLVRGNVDKPIKIAEAPYQFSIANPQFSQDGRYLAFCVQNPQTNDYPVTYYLDTLNLEKYKVPADGSCEYDWSPDGKTLIFTQPAFMGFEPRSPEGIWAYSLQAGTVELMIATQNSIIDPRWAPDGKYISYFDFCFECIGQFYTYNVVTRHVLEWSQFNSDWYIGPDVSWSPDGQYLAFDKGIWVYASEGESYGLYVASSDGQTRTQIYSIPGRSAFFPLWSPDGELIAFGSFENFVSGNYLEHRSDLMSISSDGSDRRTLYSASHEIFPQSWSPDSRYLLISESLSGTEDRSQKQQLIIVDVETGNPVWTKTTSYTYSSADWAALPDSTNETQPSSVLLAGHSGILFVTTDYALAFYEPDTQKVEKLTAPFSGETFSASPDGKTILFGNQIISLTSAPDGKITTSMSNTVFSSDHSLVQWSPDSQKYAYEDDNRQVWVGDIRGSRQQLPDGNSLPEWSLDGRWFAYCDASGRLWLADGGSQANVIAQSDYCDVSWSPSQLILVYSLHPQEDEEHFAEGTAYLYDPASAQTRPIAQQMSSVSWSPDGNLVSISRVTAVGASAVGYEISALNPDTGQELAIEEFNSRSDVDGGWLKQKNDYLVGGYRFPADFSSKTKIADIVFDATFDGSQMLLGNYNNNGVDVECRDLTENTTFPLLEIDLADTPGVAMPGMGGQLSPDGKWVVLSDFDGATTVHWLTRCGVGGLVSLSENVGQYEQYFSPDSSWLIIEETDLSYNPIFKISFRNLQNGLVHEIQAAGSTRSNWFHMPDPTPGSSTAIPDPIQASNMADQPAKYDTNPTLVSRLPWVIMFILLIILIYYLWKQTASLESKD